MTLRIAFVLLAASAVPAFAQAKTDDLDAFNKELDALFVKGGLTADQAASRAGGVSPTVRRKVAEVDAAIATAEATELARVPQVGGKASYTRLSAIPSAVIPLGGQNFVIPFLQNSYLLEGTVQVNLSDYVLRYPKLVEAAHLAEDVASVTRKNSVIGAGQDARLAYYEWVRSKLQVLIAERQLAQVRATLRQFQALADAQRLSKADLMRVQAQEADADQTLDQLQNLSLLREEQLRILIGAGNEPLAIGEDIRADLAAVTRGQLDDAMTKAKAQRLDFRQLDLGIQAKDKQRQAERANELPRLSAFGVADYARPNQRFFPQTDEFKFTWQVGVQATWTLNDTLIARTTDHRLRAETNELVADRENLDRGTRIEVLAAQQAVAIAEHALVTSQKGLNASEESYRVRKELLAADRATAVRDGIDTGAHCIAQRPRRSPCGDGPAGSCSG